jgi:transposase-like protein
MAVPVPSSRRETHDRQCPDCGSRSIVATGRVMASITGVRSDYLCHECYADFVLLVPGPRLMIRRG